MIRRAFLLLGIVMVALGLVACGASTSSPPTPSVTSSPSSALIRCVFKNFRATVFRGPDAGLSVQGELHVQVDASGSLVATLKQPTGPDVPPVFGQATGRAINLV